jgi:histidinol-phosphate aminotransferase
MRFPLSPGILSQQMWPSRSDEEIVSTYKLDRLIKMASNENCYGPSPRVATAFAEASTNRYPDVHAASLKKMLAENLGISEEQIVCGNGSSEVILMIAQTYLQSGTNCITGLETFPVYRKAVAIMDASLSAVPLKNDRYDLKGMIDAIRAETRLIFIANPNNPTGTRVDESEFRKFLEAVPPNILVVKDEAYREYMEEPEDGLQLLSQFENLIVLRTFSKVYGLAGLRIGYAVSSPEIISNLNRVRLPYAVNIVAQQAACAALQDQDHVQQCVKQNREQRNLVEAEFRRRSYSFVPSQANFILLKTSEASKTCEGLLQKGILVAPMHLFYLPDAIRITLGTEEENHILLKELTSFTES